LSADQGRREIHRTRNTQDYHSGRGWFNQHDEAVEILGRLGETAVAEENLVDALIDAVRAAKPPEDAEE
jgi:hypothetical protein